MISHPISHKVLFIAKQIPQGKQMTTETEFDFKQTEIAEAVNEVVGEEEMYGDKPVRR